MSVSLFRIGVIMTLLSFLQLTKGYVRYPFLRVRIYRYRPKNRNLNSTDSQLEPVNTNHTNCWDTTGFLNLALPKNRNLNRQSTCNTNDTPGMLQAWRISSKGERKVDSKNRCSRIPGLILIIRVQGIPWKQKSYCASYVFGISFLRKQRKETKIYRPLIRIYTSPLHLATRVTNVDCWSKHLIRWRLILIIRKSDRSVFIISRVVVMMEI